MRGLSIKFVTRMLARQSDPQTTSLNCLKYNLIACLYRNPGRARAAPGIAMFANGYVGSTEDAQRLRKLDKQRQEQRKKFEELQDKKRREAAGLRQFGASKAEAYEAAFKNETVGLVTRKEFIEKRNTIQERLAEDELRERLEAEAAAQAEKERRKKEKEKKKAKSKLSFAAEVSSQSVACRQLLIQ
eukprot:GHRR01026003.1.p1 GENE.GHRR01026003.1~~GHRR01026003.1.p1  ORF type:complete len:187 (+),score=49.65 GHRR01026003.1:342-902(+)